MEAMTSEREAFEVRKGSNGEWGIYAKGYNVRIATFETVSALTRNRVAELLAGDANIAQPAQVVDVGAIREVAGRLMDGNPYGMSRGVCRSLADRLTRALSGEKAGPVGDGWQPIETAPKDGSAVLVAFTADGERQVAEAYWSDDDDVWVCSRDGFMLYSRNEPTHFQPMPPLPASPTPGKEGA